MRKVLLLFTAICLFFDTMAQYAYPPTKTVDSSDTYFGVTYRDPYRWLEYMKEPQAETWFKQQATYTDSVLNKLNGRDELIAEWEQDDMQFPAHFSNRVYESGRIFYRKTTSAASVGKIYYREGMNGKEELLFDPTTYIPGKTISVQDFTPSYDGKKIAIDYSEQDAEITVVRIMDVDRKQFLKDSLFPAAFSSWNFDNNSFLYQAFKSKDIKDPTWRFNSKTKLHVLNEDTNADVDFFSSASYPDLNIGPEIYPYAFLDEGAKNYIFSAVEFTHYYSLREEFNSRKIPWKVLYKISDSLVDVIYFNDQVYAISHKNAPNNKVVATSLKHPDWSNPVTIAAERADWVVEDFVHSKDYLIIVYSDGINNHLSKYDFNTETISDVNLPYSGTIRVSCINTKTNNYIVHLSSWSKPLIEYDYSADRDIFTRSSFNKPFIFPSGYSDLEVEEVGVTGHDGVIVPLSIIYKKGIRKDGSNVCLLEGYGAYGSKYSAVFDWLKNSLASRGVVIAIAHVRGGGEKGEAWHKAGFKATKPNTWKDFISCAEYLISKGFTSPKKMAGEGTSAGGILISRAITERPDLFAAAICNVGLANAMRGEFTGNTGGIYEFGTLRDSLECDALYEMDGMQHVVNGTPYPAVICVAGWNDYRVPAWEPGKFAAAMQNATTSGKPILLKVNYDNGHYTENRRVTYINSANQLAFLLWQCGHPDFQPKK